MLLTVLMELICCFTAWWGRGKRRRRKRKRRRNGRSLEQGRVVLKQKELTVNTMIVLLKINL